MTHAPDETTLLPCPFCGSTRLEVVEVSRVVVLCEECHAAVHIETWNRRTPAPPPDDRAEVARWLANLTLRLQATPIMDGARSRMSVDRDLWHEITNAIPRALPHLEAPVPQASEGGDVEALVAATRDYIEHNDWFRALPLEPGLRALDPDNADDREWMRRHELRKEAMQQMRAALAANTTPAPQASEGGEVERHDCERWRWEGIGCARCHDALALPHPEPESGK